MGILRIILAISVLTAHAGPLFDVLPLAGVGVMAVESFFIISGFYMALVLTQTYSRRTGDFFFNRFLRLFPAYWITVTFALIVSLGYWLISGHPLGFVSEWRNNPASWHGVVTGFCNLFVIGTDYVEAAANAPWAAASGMNRLIALTAMWTVAGEITFYACSPWLLRRHPGVIAGFFVLTVLVRIGMQTADPAAYVQWTGKLPFGNACLFLGGALSYRAYAWLQPKRWFEHWAGRVGWGAIAAWTALILGFEHQGLVGAFDWRYYGMFMLSLPAIFAATRDSSFDNQLGAWSYPVYLTHGVAMMMMPPLRHFITSPTLFPYLVLAGTIILSALLLKADGRIQKHFKRRTSTPRVDPMGHPVHSP